MHSLRLAPSILCAAVVAILGLAACGAARLVPFARMTTRIPSLTIAARRCRQPAASFFFAGACDRVVLDPPGRATALLADYRGITAAVTLFPRTSVAKGARVTIVDATGKRDVKPYDGKAFPHVNGRGKPLVYLKFVVAGTTADMRRSPYINITDTAKIRGSSCTVEFLEGNGWKATNYRVPIFDARVVRFLPMRAQFNLPHGSSYLVVVCGLGL
ncbi:MAG: hypothetical protein JO092_05535 [Candidatus Eremiobacteraeota bacterium]|nr:hypothetical protein [Candidatus Eremiobacteraeota bacterium]